MPQGLANYLAAARHPWACVLFVVPLLALYESGFHVSATTELGRTGADAWFRLLLSRIGITHLLAAPILLLAGLIAWGFLRSRAPLEDPLGTIAGMAVESLVFAGLLFGLAQLSFPLLRTAGGVIQEPMRRLLEVSSNASPTSPAATWETLLRFMGAGIYEETLFRLVLFSLLRMIFLAADFVLTWAVALAALVSALLFAAAHHVGGVETFDATVFLYRTLAGLYFAGLFQARGFGVAVGAHAGFDVLVGLVLR